MLSTTPKLYSHKELNEPAKQAVPMKPPPANPYLLALYLCGESFL